MRLGVFRLLGFVAGCRRCAGIRKNPPFSAAVKPDMQRRTLTLFTVYAAASITAIFGEHVGVAGAEAQLVVESHSNEIRTVRCLPKLQEKARSTISDIACLWVISADQQIMTGTIVIPVGTTLARSRHREAGFNAGHGRFLCNTPNFQFVMCLSHNSTVVGARHRVIGQQAHHHILL